MQIDEREFERAAEVLRGGGVVAFPTETVYGLGANALDRNAVRRIYEIKGRPSTSPLIVHVNSVHMAQELVTAWPGAADLLAKRFWPGPLTLVLPKAAHVPDEITAGLGTVGIRIPSHPVALELIRRAGVPVAAPSANPFMGLSPTRAEHVAAGLGSRVDVILDGGPADVGIESTVVSLVGERPLLLRPGMVTRKDLEAVLGEVDVLEGALHAEQAHAAPGLHDRHYSPRTPLYIVDSATWKRPLGRGVYLFRTQPEPGIENRPMPASARDFAAVLYDALHDCDGEGWDYIAVESVPETTEWAGVRDRLNRARVR